jgi:signal transduction histidine kinase
LLGRLRGLQAAARARIAAEQLLQEDRLRISRDLHDNVGAHLSQIVVALGSLERENGLNNTKLGALKRLSQTTIAQLRETIWTLHDDQINAADFSDKLIRYAARQAALNTQLKLTIIRPDIDDLEAAILAPLQALNLYRIAQEAINNAFKYANSTQITLQFDYQKTIFSLIIGDNGTGFDLEDLLKQESYGLQNMRFRANEIKADFEINTTKTQGTSVKISIALATV